MLEFKELELIPNHIAFICDGNGRWAERRGLPRSLGHQKGAEVVKKLIRQCSDLGVKHLTLYLFTTENWALSDSEAQYLIQSLSRFLQDCRISGAKQKIKVNHIGIFDSLPEEIIDEVKKTISETAKFTGMNLNLALNYGGRSAIVQATNEIIADIENNNIKPEEINDNLFSVYINGKTNIPNPDIVVRTSGGKRLSNFLLWDSEYSKLFFPDVLFPDFKEEHLSKIIDDWRN